MEPSELDMEANALVVGGLFVISVFIIFILIFGITLFLWLK